MEKRTKKIVSIAAVATAAMMCVFGAAQLLTVSKLDVTLAQDPELLAVRDASAASDTLAATLTNRIAREQSRSVLLSKESLELAYEACTEALSTTNGYVTQGREGVKATDQSIRETCAAIGTRQAERALTYGDVADSATLLTKSHAQTASYVEERRAHLIAQDASTEMAVKRVEGMAGWKDARSSSEQ